MERLILVPSDCYRLLPDVTTPSGIYVSPAGPLKIRYYLAGKPQGVFFATGIFDLIAQTTKEAKGFNGYRYVCDRYFMLMEMELAIRMGLSRYKTFIHCLENELNILIAEFTK